MKNVLTALAGSVLLFTSCKKNEQVLDPNISGNSTVSNQLSEMFKSNENDIKQNFSINTQYWQSINSVKGTRIDFEPNSFETKNGQSVTGNVEIELVEIFDKANMVLLNKSTNGKLSTGETSTLVSGGQVKVNAYKDGEELVLKEGKAYYVTVSSANTGALDYDMKLFEGVVGDGEDIEWFEEEDTINAREDSSGSNYSWSDSSFGWTNIDKFYSDPRPKTEIYVEVPEGYDDSNCEVFLSYDGEPTALSSLDIYDETTKKFTEHYGLMPVGLDVHFIFVTEKDGKIVAKIQGATITNNHIETIESPTEFTKTQLTSDIFALP